MFQTVSQYTFPNTKYGDHGFAYFFKTNLIIGSNQKLMQQEHYVSLYILGLISLTNPIVLFYMNLL